MNITFMIGNGFDIGLGMHSSFKDFFPIFKAHCLEKNEQLKGMAKDINDNEDKWSYFEKQLGEYTSKFSNYETEKFKAEVKEFEIDFVEYLSSQEEFLDFSQKDSISKMFINGLINFYSIENLHEGSHDTISNCISNNRTSSMQYNFINFNYTDCLSKCISAIPDGIVRKRNFKTTELVDKIGQIVHVHGKKNLNPIMGVNDESQISNIDFANNKRLIKYIVKPVHNKTIRMNNDVRAINLITESEIICVYGMSIGETDKIWWETLINCLFSNPSRQLIFFIYNENYSENSQFEWMEQQDILMDTLSSFLPNANIDNLLPRIHIAIQKNIFKMDLRKQKVSLAEEFAAQRWI